LYPSHTLQRAHRSYQNRLLDQQQFFRLNRRDTIIQKTINWRAVVRRREHLGSNKKGESIKAISSAIRDPINDPGHSASLDNFCIIDRANNELDLLIHKSLLVLRDHLTLTFQISLIPLCLI